MHGRVISVYVFDRKCENCFSVCQFFSMKVNSMGLRLRSSKLVCSSKHCQSESTSKQVKGGARISFNQQKGGCIYASHNTLTHISIKEMTIGKSRNCLLGTHSNLILNSLCDFWLGIFWGLVEKSFSYLESIYLSCGQGFIIVLLRPVLKSSNPLFSIMVISSSRGKWCWMPLED